MPISAPLSSFSIYPDIPVRSPVVNLAKTASSFVQKEITLLSPIKPYELEISTKAFYSWLENFISSFLPVVYSTKRVRKYRWRTVQTNVKISPTNRKVTTKKDKTIKESKPSLKNRPAVSKRKITNSAKKTNKQTIAQTLQKQNICKQTQTIKTTKRELLEICNTQNRISNELIEAIRLIETPNDLLSALCSLACSMIHHNLIDQAGRTIEKLLELEREINLIAVTGSDVLFNEGLFALMTMLHDKKEIIPYELLFTYLLRMFQQIQQKRAELNQLTVSYLNTFILYLIAQEDPLYTETLLQRQINIDKVFADCIKALCEVAATYEDISLLNYLAEEYPGALIAYMNKNEGFLKIAVRNGRIASFDWFIDFMKQIDSLKFSDYIEFVIMSSLFSSLEKLSVIDRNGLFNELVFDHLADDDILFVHDLLNMLHISFFNGLFPYSHRLTERSRNLIKSCLSILDKLDGLSFDRNSLDSYLRTILGKRKQEHEKDEDRKRKK